MSLKWFFAGFGLFLLGVVALLVGYSMEHKRLEILNPVNHTPKEQVQFFNIEQGLVKVLLRDGAHVWLGTSDGLLRYDTQNDKMEHYTNQNSGLLSNGILFLGKLDGRLWVGTYGGGLSILDGAKWSNYNIPQGLADAFVYSAAKAPNGDVWLATWSGANQIVGGQLDDPKAWRTYNVENTHGGLPNKWVYALAPDPSGRIWMATEGGLALYDGTSWRHWSHNDGLGADYARVKNALSEGSDPAQLSKHHAQDRVDQGLEGINAPYNPNYIVSLLLDSKGRVWCGTWGGGVSVLEDGKFVRTYASDNGLSGNYVQVVAEGPDGTIWAGGEKGLSHLVEGAFTTRFVRYSEKNGWYRDSVYALTFADDHSTWYGGTGGAIRFMKGLE